jgi:hypothetical protein
LDEISTIARGRGIGPFLLARFGVRIPKKIMKNVAMKTVARSQQSVLNIVFTAFMTELHDNRCHICVQIFFIQIVCMQI